MYIFTKRNRITFHNKTRGNQCFNIGKRIRDDLIQSDSNNYTTALHIAVHIYMFRCYKTKGRICRDFMKKKITD